jgi:hypothetical protein
MIIADNRRCERKTQQKRERKVSQFVHAWFRDLTRAGYYQGVNDTVKRLRRRLTQKKDAAWDPFNSLTHLVD